MRVLRVIHDFINEHFKKNPPNMDDVLDIPDIVNMYTYDDYEFNNPLHINFWERKIENKIMRESVNTTQNVGADELSAYTNYYYIPHRIINLPKDYKNIIEVYKKYSNSTEKKPTN